MNNDLRDKPKEEEDSDLTNPHFEDEDNDWNSADSGDLDIEAEQNWLDGIYSVVKPKEIPMDRSIYGEWI